MTNPSDYRDPAWVRLADWLLDDRPVVGVAIAGAVFTAAVVVINVWRVIT